MTAYKIHPIVLGTKIFDKGMMTYQHDYGREYVMPIYAWYLEGGDLIFHRGVRPPDASGRLHRSNQGRHRRRFSAKSAWGRKSCQPNPSNMTKR